MTEAWFDDFYLFALPVSQAAAIQRNRLETSLAKQVAVQMLTFVASHFESRDDVRPEVFDVLSRWVSAKPNFWTREIGHLWRAVHVNDEVAMQGSIIDIAIHASCAGIAGVWSFSLPVPKSIKLFDMVLNSVCRGSISSADGAFYGEFELLNCRILIEVKEGKLFVEQMGGNNTNRLSAPLISVLGHQFHLVSSRLASHDLLPAHGKRESEYCDDLVGEGILPTIAAFELLHRSSPLSYEWVSSVLREIVPLRSKNGGSGSTSSFWDWGTIAVTLSDQMSPVLLAEMLVHEASHQHFFLAKQLGALDDGSDTHDYFSPMVNASRSLEKMFLGYHALVNMLLFYEGVSLRSRADFGDLATARIKHLIEKLNCISPVVSTTSAFTPLGACMLQQLQTEEQRLREYFS